MTVINVIQSPFRLFITVKVIFLMPNKFLFINLTRGTSALNFVSFLFASLFTIALFVFLNATQPKVVSSLPDTSKVQLGQINGSLVFYDQILSIILLGTWGALSDKLGRVVIHV
jgi:hypothetical protein